MLLTVFLRSGWMSQGSISGILMEDLSAKNVTLPKNEVTAIARHIARPMWNWHVYVGYALAGMFAVRVLYIFTKGTKCGNPFSKKLTSMQERIQAAVYFLFYLSLGVTLLSGLMMKLGPSGYNRIFKPFHEPSLYFMVAFLAVHLMGILMGEHGDEKGVVSAMIHGGENDEKN
ncbi:MAG: cytochrome b/b6 domain-containing protein [Polyangiaceae bacterium]|nr:cytochrome b/b6 domain-containing protein [Polyangiaceae bacterium]